MSGQAGARGYLLQTLICVLDGLDDANQWLCVTIEPNDQSEKVDIVWDYGRRKKAVQVKSSQNQIDLPSAKKWASELESSADADDLELRLLGPCSHRVSTVLQIGAVRVPAPEIINIKSLTEQAAHKLDRYLATRELSMQLGPFVRELVVGALSHRFGIFSTGGDAVSRNDFDAMLASWIAELQPPIAPTPHKRSGSGPVRQIGAPPHDFVGRDDELERLEDAIGSGARLVGVRGMPGVGKSAFMSKLAAAVAGAFSGWHIQLDLRGHTSRPTTIVEAMRLVLQAANSDITIPTEPSALAGLYRSALQGVDAILFFENVPSADVITALDPMSDVLILFTSRDRFTVPNLTHANLLPLDPTSSNELLLSIAPSLGDAAHIVAELCGFLPLALRVAACTFAERPDIGNEEFVERLTHKRAVLEFAEASIQLSYDRLDDEVKQRFCLLALFPFDFDVQATAAVWAVDAAAADTTVGSLIRSSMIEWDESRRRYWMHDLIRDFVGDRADETHLTEAKWRFCEYFRDVCLGVEETYKRGHEEVLDALFQFDSERPNLEMAVGWLSWKAQDDANAAQMCVDYVSSTVFPRDIRQHPIERIRWLSMGFEAAQKIPDGISALSFLGNIGRAWADFGDIDQALAIHQKALAAALQFKVRPNECVGHLQVGNMQALMGNFREAVLNFDEAQVIAVELKNRSLEGHALANSGYALFKLCEFESAKKRLLLGSKIFADLGDQLNFAKALQHLGELALTAGEHSLAIEMYEDSYGIASDLNDPLSMMQIGRELGKARTATGDHQLAVTVLEKNVSLAKQLGIAKFVFAGLRALATAYECANMSQRADATIDEHQTVAESIGDKEIARDGRKTLATILEKRGCLNEAITIYEEELDEVRKDESPDDEMSVLGALSRLCKLSGDKGGAIRCLERVCEIARQINHPFAVEFAEKVNELRHS